jgi:hypothetical protein
MRKGKGNREDGETERRGRQREGGDRDEMEKGREGMEYGRCIRLLKHSHAKKLSKGIVHKHNI